MKLRRLFKRLMIGIGFAILLLCLIVVGTVALILYYPQLGRLGGFQELRQSVNLEGTNYVIELNDNRILLTNTLTQSSLTLRLEVDDNFPLKYRLLHHQDNDYLLTMSLSGGSAGGYWFDIYNITSDRPYDLLRDYDLSVGFSCVYPRLNGNVLEFETAHDCEGFLFKPNKRTYTVQLR